MKIACLVCSLVSWFGRPTQKKISGKVLVFHAFQGIVDIQAIHMDMIGPMESCSVVLSCARSHLVQVFGRNMRDRESHREQRLALLL